MRVVREYDEVRLEGTIVWGPWRLSAAEDKVNSLRDDFESVEHANGLILTPPVPQTLQLLHQSLITLPDDIDGALSGVTYERCFAVYGVFEGREPLLVLTCARPG